MANIRSLQRSFGGGELTPEFFGRIDDAKYQTGLALCRNFVVAPHGPVANRAGTLFVRGTKNDLLRSSVRPFSYSDTQTMVLEFGDQYIRFHTQGATLLAGSPATYNGATPYEAGELVALGGVNYYAKQDTTGNSPPNATYWYPLPSDAYEVPSPYLEDDIPNIHWVQSADVLTLVHPNYETRELRRLGAVQWVLAVVDFASSLAPPTLTSATPTVTGTDLTNQSYVLTAIGGDAGDESLQSNVVSCTNNLNAIGAYNTLAWSAHTEATRYNVFKLDNGLYGFIGQTTGLTFVDDNIAPDLSITPPEDINPFVGAGNYPAAVTYFEQRRAFGGTLNRPQNAWLTKSGTEKNLQYSIPTRDDDSITFKFAAREASTIRHLVPLDDLIMLTSSSVVRVAGADGGPLTPASVSAKPQAYNGASNVQPVLVNNFLVFAAARGGHVLQLVRSNEAQGYTSGDLCLRAAHLFDGLEVQDMTLAKSPQPIIWSVSSAGVLLGLTYIPEENIGAWHWHDTINGVFESCCTVAEGSEDALYVVVRRTINGQTKRFIERFVSRRFSDPEDAFFVDCGLTYVGPPTDTLSGLDHLEGETVSILADASVRPPQVVVGGSITLDQEASKAHVGLPIEADLKTLPLAFEAQAFGQGRVKNVTKVWLRVFGSSGIFAGPDFNRLTEAKIRTTEPFGSPPSLKTGEVSLNITGAWADSGEVCIRQSDPLPLTLVALSLEAAIGG